MKNVTFKFNQYKMVLIMMVFSILTNVANAQCGLSGPGTGGNTITCNPNTICTYTSTCSPFSIAWGIDSPLNTYSITSNTTFDTPEFTVVSASATQIKIKWKCTCTTTSSTTIYYLTQGSSEFFNPTVRVSCTGSGSTCPTCCLSIADFNCGSGAYCKKFTLAGPTCTGTSCFCVNITFTDGTTLNDVISLTATNFAILCYQKQIQSISYAPVACPCPAAGTKMGEIDTENAIDTKRVYIVPNPVINSQFDAIFNSDKEQHVKCVLMDINGQAIQSKEVTVLAGDNKIDFTCDNCYESAMYILTIFNENGQVLGHEKISFLK